MNNRLVNIIVFLAGSFVGVAGSYYFIKKHFENIFNEDLQERRLAHIEANSQTDNKTSEEKSNANRNKLDISSYMGAMENYGSPYTHVDYSKPVPEEASNEEQPVIKNLFQEEIHIISQGEFVDNDHDESWEAIGLTFFKDGVLADENNDEFKDPEHFVGPISNIDHFFLISDSDVVYVRNPMLKIDYEICYDNRCYSDVKKTMPTPIREEEDTE